MTRDEILSEVRRQMAEMFEIDPERIKAEALLGEDLELDSIDAIDLAVKIEALTGRRVNEHALRTVRTVSDVVELIASMVGETVPQPRAVAE
jgi:acyl carrier protein